MQNTLTRHALMSAPALALLLAACGGGGSAEPEGRASPQAAARATADGSTAALVAPATSAATAVADGTPAAGRLAVSTVASGLVNPWSLAFLPDGRMLVTEKPGRLRTVQADGSLSAPITGVPSVSTGGQGGLFDVALARDFATSRRIFLSYAESGTGSEAGRNGLAVGTAVLSADGAALQDWQVIFRQTPKVSSSLHFGGRLVLTPDGQIFITTGERSLASERGRAQLLEFGHGKVFRLALNGSPPRNNPFNYMRTAQQGIYSYGHRNPQGAALHPDTGALWVTEHGPQGGDELNRIVPGANYGWPLVSYGCEYGSPVGNCTPVGGASTGPGFTPPVSYWVPTSIAPSGLAIHSGNGAPQWRGDFFVGALAGQAVWQLKMNGDQVVSRAVLPTGLNDRIRDVREGPDGALYLLTDSSAGRVVRVAP